MQITCTQRNTSTPLPACMEKLRFYEFLIPAGTEIRCYKRLFVKRGCSQDIDAVSTFTETGGWVFPAESQRKHSPQPVHGKGCYKIPSALAWTHEGWQGEGNKYKQPRVELSQARKHQQLGSSSKICRRIARAQVKSKKWTLWELQHMKIQFKEVIAILILISQVRTLSISLSQFTQ